MTSSAGAGVGVLLCHGFTGSPSSMQPWADHLAGRGYTTRVPLLPGHGTRWQDMNDTTFDDWLATVTAALAELSDSCDLVFVAGLSMGGTLALRLAAEHSNDVAGVVVVNPSLSTADKRAFLLPYVSKIVSSFPPIGDDIKAPGVSEFAYPRLPLRAAASMQELWAETIPLLGRITAPVLAFRSANDHVVPPSSLQILRAGAIATTVAEHVLPDSYHVAILDNDAPTIFAESLRFIAEHNAGQAGAPRRAPNGHRRATGSRP